MGTYLNRIVIVAMEEKQGTAYAIMTIARYAIRLLHSSRHTPSTPLIVALLEAEQKHPVYTCERRVHFK